jgi:hypothetical protein
MSGRLLAVVAGLLAAFAVASPARADIGDETALAERYAPVVRLVAQAEECGYGEPYRPMDVDALFGEPTVALRGPWTEGDLVRIGPSARELSGALYEYHLDFPGNPLQPGCSYEQWADQITTGFVPTVYAHVATDPGAPGKLALQYWFFYAFNDFNNTHEGDWEMIQLVFDAGTAAEALSVSPTEVGYSQHEGAERADWDDSKLELVGGTHPVVHPAAGSHANFFEDGLYLGSSGQQGVGCDDATTPTVELRPRVRTIPNDEAAARRDFPWIAYEGRWGELQAAFYNGPTGPNLKRQWTEPIAYTEGWRERSYAVPAGGLLGTEATDFFCSALRTGSDALRRTVDEPSQTLLPLALLLLVAILAVRATTWRPAAPLRVARQRAWGQVLAAATRMYLTRWPLFLGIAAVFIPIALLIAAVEAAVFGSASILGVDTSGESGGVFASLAVAVAAILTLGGVGLVQAATARALAEVDAGRPIGPLRAYRMALGRFPRLLGALAIAVTAVVLLGLTVALLPVAVWLAGRWALLAQAVELEGASVPGALGRSSRLVRRRWFKTASLVVAGAAIALVLGPVLGMILILGTDAPFTLVNVVAGLVYLLAMPFVALTTAYVYFDAIVSESTVEEDVLPAQVPV